MGKLSLSVFCAAAALAIPSSAHARGTYHHAEPYVVHLDKHKSHSWAPVKVYSAAHGHYHLTYHPEE
jgi:hypothetical protein